MVANVYSQILLAHELLAAVRAHKIFFTLVNFLVVEKRRNVSIALPAYVTNVEVCFRHVLSHVDLMGSF